MLCSTAAILFGSLAVPTFDDHAVVDFHLVAMAEPDKGAICATPAVAPIADHPVRLVYLDSPAPTTPALDLVPPTSLLAAMATRDNAVPRVPFAPLDEPAFERDSDPFVLVRDEGGQEIARGWLRAERGDVEWAQRPFRSRAPTSAAFVNEYLGRLKTLRSDPDVVELERSANDGESLKDLLDDAALDEAATAAWITALEEAAGPVTLVERQRISMIIGRRDRALRMLRVDVDDASTLVVVDRGSSIVAERIPAPKVRRLRAVGGEIRRSLYQSALAADVPEETVAQMAEILGWEVDLSRVHQGARYRAVYEETVRRDTNEAIPGRVLAVEVSDSGRTYEGYYFAERGGDDGAYYTREARPLGGSLLRYPVSFTRISSYFSDSRFHPIKNRRMPHYGVDFAAPTGTPVVAAGDGVVRAAGWAGSSGRLVRIDHEDTYVSAYAHLSRIAAGVTRGARVTQGQVIGYVGSSGLATGPHLHYAVFRNGKYVDPLQVVIGRQRELDGIERTAFHLALGTIDDAFDRAGLGNDAVVQVSMAVKR